MKLHDLASTSFVLLPADATVDEARRAFAAGAATHLIVGGGSSEWWLLTHEAALAALSGAPSQAPLASALGLRDRPATPVLNGLLSAEFAPDRLVVMEEGEVMGFIDREAAARRTEPPARDAAPVEPTPHDFGDVERRALEAEFPDAVTIDAIARLRVTLASRSVNPDDGEPDLVPGDVVDVLVQPRRGFDLAGDDRGTLTVPSRGQSRPLNFDLRAVEPGPGELRVLAFRTGEPLAGITLESHVEPASERPTRGITPPRRRRRKLVRPSPQLPDLTLFVEEWEASGQRNYRMLLSAPDPELGLNLATFGPFELELDPATFFEEFFEEIDRLPRETKADRDVADRRVAAKGAYLSEQLMPEALREKLWEVRDQISSIIVQSEEPWIPWELCRLIGHEGGRVVEGPFLCEAYTITRWLPGIGFKRPLSLEKIAVVVPDDSGLPLATLERDFVLSLADGGRKVTALPATFDAVQDAFAEGTFDGWHFTGHGVARDENPDRSAMVLVGGEALTPETVSGRGANVGACHPVVFINACQVGRSGMALTGIGGWANRFVEAGAGAFIGAYWSVFDEPAYEFARELYTRLIDGNPVGQAVRDARLAIRSPGDPTWLAYTVFADPLATIGT